MTAISLPDPSPELRGDGVLLTPWEERDLPRILEIADDIETRTWSGSLAGVRTIADAQHWVDDRTGPGRVDWAVRDPDSLDLIGRSGMGAFHDLPATGEIGYGVHPAHRRRGVALAAVAAVTRWAYAELGLTRIELVHDVGNTASCAIANRSGYRLEGHEHQSLGYPDGRVADAHRHARLSTDPDRAGRPDLAGQPVTSMLPLVPRMIEAEGLLLRPWTPDDAAAVLVGLTDPLTVRWNPRLPLCDLAAASGWVSERTRRWTVGEAASWAVCADGAVVGSVGLRELNAVDAVAVVSYWTMPAARGRGVAAAALQAATAYAFDDLGLHRVQLAHAVANTGSCRVAGRAGFALEGVLRGSNRLVEGFADEHLHARLASDLTAPGMA